MKFKVVKMVASMSLLGAIMVAVPSKAAADQIHKNSRNQIVLGSINASNAVAYYDDDYYWHRGRWHHYHDDWRYRHHHRGLFHILDDIF